MASEKEELREIGQRMQFLREACDVTIEEMAADLDVDVEKGETPLDLDYTPNVGKKRDIRVALSNSLGFGGHNGILVLRKV